MPDIDTATAKRQTPDTVRPHIKTFPKKTLTMDARMRYYLLSLCASMQ